MDGFEWASGNRCAVDAIQNRQTFIPWAVCFNYRYRIALPEELVAITERERSVMERWQRSSHYRYRFSLEIQFVAITGTDFGLETNKVMIAGTSVLKHLWRA